MCYRIGEWLRSRKRRAHQQRGGSTIYLSYSRADKELAWCLYERLTDLGVDVCVDSHRSLPARDPKERFVQGLMASQAFVPILSREALRGLQSSAAANNADADASDTPPDPFFLELRLALELHRSGRLRLILPLIREPLARFAPAEEDAREGCARRMRHCASCVRACVKLCVSRAHFLRRAVASLLGMTLDEQPVGTIEAAVQRHLHRTMAAHDAQSPRSVVTSVLSMPSVLVRGDACSEAVTNVAELARLLGKQKLRLCGELRQRQRKLCLCTHFGVRARRSLNRLCCSTTLDLARLVASHEDEQMGDRAIPRSFLGTLDMPGEFSDKNLQVNPVVLRRGEKRRKRKITKGDAKPGAITKLFRSGNLGKASQPVERTAQQQMNQLNRDYSGILLRQHGPGSRSPGIVPGSAAARAGVKTALERQRDARDRMVACEESKEHRATVVQGGRHKARPSSIVSAAACGTGDAEREGQRDTDVADGSASTAAPCISAVRGGSFSTQRQDCSAII